MKLSELYTEYFANWVSDGGMIRRDKMSLIGIRALFDRFLTNQYINSVWIIADIPVHYDKNLTQMIRSEMYERYSEVSTIIHMYAGPVSIRVHSDIFRRQMNSAAKKYYQYRDIFESLSEVERETGVTERVNGVKLSLDREMLERIKDNYDSYMYVHNAVCAGKEFCNVHYFVQASFKDRETMHKYDKDLTQLMLGQDIGIRKVHGNVGKYLNNYCPATFKQETDSKFRTSLFSQENMAAFMPSLTKGLVGKAGIMLGLNWETKLPFRLDLTSSGTAQVIMIEGTSGCGKTFLSFEIAIELTSFGIHCSVTDIKGGEWSKLSKYVDTLEIDMSGDSARFVNLMRLDDLGCDAFNCTDAFDSAVNNTVGLFEVCTNLQSYEGNKADLRSILSQAVEKIFSIAGVDKHIPETFKLTKEFSYESVLEVVSTLESSKAYTEDQKKLCKIIRTRCAPYFLGEGRYSSAFKNELSVADILETPMVVYNFNKNTGEALDIIDEIRIFMSRCLDSRKHFIRKQKKLHQAAFYEELQRCGSMEALINNISSDVTGSRSNNLTVFLLLNAVSTFDAKNFAAIKSNITTCIIGNSKEEDIAKLVKEYDCKNIEKFMYKIHNNVKLLHCFAVSYNTGNDRDSLILKTIVPEDMQEHFRTRDVYEIG